LNLERLTRDMQGFLDINRQVVEDGLRVHLCEERETIDANSAKDQKCFWRMKVVFFEYAIDDLKDKARRSIEGRLERGGWPFVRPPFGYDLDHNVLTINEDAEFVRRAFDIYAQGLDNTRTLHEKLVPEGLKLSQPALSQVLRNCAYIGEIEWPWPESRYVTGKHHLGERLKGNHEAIIARPLFDKVQALLTQRSKGHPFKKGRPFFLYRGLIRCECGKVMSGGMINGVVRYQSNHTPEKFCVVKGIQGSAVDRAVEMVLHQFSAPSEPMRRALELAFAVQHKTVRGDRAKAQAEYDKAQRSLDVAFSKAVREAFDPETLNRNVGELKTRRDRAKAMLDHLAVVGKEDKAQFVKDGLELFKVLNNLNSAHWAKPERRAILLRRLFKEIQLKADKTIRVVVEDQFGPLFNIRNLIEQVADQRNSLAPLVRVVHQSKEIQKALVCPAGA